MSASHPMDRTSRELIREALYPYPRELAIVSKVAVGRDAGAVIRHDDARQLRAGIEDNLRSLRVDQLAAVNLRLPGPGRAGARFDDQLAAMVPGPRRGTHRRYRPEQRRPRTAPARRGRYRDRLRAEPVPPRRPRLDPGLPGVHPPWHRLRAVRPLGLPRGAANPVLTSPVVIQTAARLGATPAQVALQWLLQLAPNVLLIPGTGSTGHLLENLAAEYVTLDDQALRELAGVGA